MRSFQPYDYQILSGWMAQRGLDAPKMEFLPPTGLIEDNVACGFLIGCDNGVGILDYFISNPDIPIEERDVALDDIVYTLILTATRSGLKQIYCNSALRSIKARAEKHGFSLLGEYASYLKEL